MNHGEESIDINRNHYYVILLLIITHIVKVVNSPYIIKVIPENALFAIVSFFVIHWIASRNESFKAFLSICCNSEILIIVSRIPCINPPTHLISAGFFHDLIFWFNKLNFAFSFSSVFKIKAYIGQSTIRFKLIILFCIDIISNDIRYLEQRCFFFIRSFSINEMINIIQSCIEELRCNLWNSINTDKSCTNKIISHCCEGFANLFYKLIGADELVFKFSIKFALFKSHIESFGVFCFINSSHVISSFKIITWCD